MPCHHRLGPPQFGVLARGRHTEQRVLGNSSGRDACDRGSAPARYQARHKGSRHGARTGRSRTDQTLQHFARPRGYHSAMGAVWVTRVVMAYFALRHLCSLVYVSVVLVVGLARRDRLAVSVSGCRTPSISLNRNRATDRADTELSRFKSMRRIVAGCQSSPATASKTTFNRPCGQDPSRTAGA